MHSVPGLDAAVLEAANINPTTGLATDYLHHYNEVAMMIAMLRDAPEMAETVLDWRPLGYAAHFQLTGFAHQAAAIAAYDRSGEGVKARFRTAKRRVELAIADVQDLIAASPGDPAEAVTRAAPIFALIAAVGAVINGETGLGPAPAFKSGQASANASFN